MSTAPEKLRVGELIMIMERDPEAGMMRGGGSFINFLVKSGQDKAAKNQRKVAPRLPQNCRPFEVFQVSGRVTTPTCTIHKFYR